MVDIRGKADTHRCALASGKVYLGQTAYELVRDNQLKKGNVLTVAQLAGVSPIRPRAVMLHKAAYSLHFVSSSSRMCS